jgi:tetratricopeptide (TPR) repeat protein
LCMDAPESLTERYLQLLDHIVGLTLKGQIRSKTQVGELLSQGTQAGTAEIFERCLSHRLQEVSTQIEALTDEFKLAKANRSLKALQTIASEWQRLQTQTLQEQSVKMALTAICQNQEPLQVISHALDPNRPDALTAAQVGQLAQALTQNDLAAAHLTREDLQTLANGLKQGLSTWQSLEGKVVGWIYETEQTIGFGESTRVDPWHYWAKQIPGTWLSQLFQGITRGDTVTWLIEQPQIQLADWVEAVVALTFLQRALVTWFERQVYAETIGRKLLISIYLSFAALWGQLSGCWQGCQKLPSQQRQQLSQHCLQLCLQVLQTFSEQDYFPLYGGIFATLNGQSLRRILNHLDVPLQQLVDSQPKARILTLLAYAQQVQGQYEQAQTLYQQAMEIGLQLPDPLCVTANLNHLSRLHLWRKHYETAIGYGQRALVLSRQQGNTLGEANALANLGFGEIFAAQQTNPTEPIDPEICERAIAQLQRGAQLGELLQDPQIQALCGCSLGLAYLNLAEPSAAIEPFMTGWKAAQNSGDLYLSGLNVAYLAQATYESWHHNPEPTAKQDKIYASIVFCGCLGMYQLHQIGAMEWQRIAILMQKVRAEMGEPAFQNCLNLHRSSLLPEIGVDGFDYIPNLLSDSRPFPE